MNEKNYKKRLDFQQKVISKKSEEIESLKLENERLKLELQERDEIISSIEPMRKEMTESVKEHKRLKSEYRELVQELRQMKDVMSQEVFNNRWWLISLLWRLIKFLMK
jgi:predicted RNase H-like nuclease (RuvC/YqgF family)